MLDCIFSFGMTRIFLSALRTSYELLLTIHHLVAYRDLGIS